MAVAVFDLMKVLDHGGASGAAATALIAGSPFFQSLWSHNPRDNGGCQPARDRVRVGAGGAGLSLNLFGQSQPPASWCSNAQFCMGSAGLQPQDASTRSDEPSASISSPLVGFSSLYEASQLRCDSGIGPVQRDALASGVQLCRHGRVAERGKVGVAMGIASHEELVERR